LVDNHKAHRRILIAPRRAASNDAPGLEANRSWRRSSPRRTGEADLTRFIGPID